MIEHIQPNGRGQIRVLAVGVDASDQRGNGNAFMSRNLLEAIPKANLQPEARFALTNNDRLLRFLIRKYPPTDHRFPPFAASACASNLRMASALGGLSGCRFAQVSICRSIGGAMRMLVSGVVPVVTGRPRFRFL
jgi:hypothetical protein